MEQAARLHRRGAPQAASVLQPGGAVHGTAGPGVVLYGMRLGVAVVVLQVAGPWPREGAAPSEAGAVDGGWPPALSGCTGRQRHSAAATPGPVYHPDEPPAALPPLRPMTSTCCM